MIEKKPVAAYALASKRIKFMFASKTHFIKKTKKIPAASALASKTEKMHF